MRSRYSLHSIPVLSLLLISVVFSIPKVASAAPRADVINDQPILRFPEKVSEKSCGG